MIVPLAIAGLVAALALRRRTGQTASVPGQTAVGQSDDADAMVRAVQEALNADAMATDATRQSIAKAQAISAARAAGGSDAEVRAAGKAAEQTVAARHKEAVATRDRVEREIAQGAHGEPARQALIASDQRARNRSASRGPVDRWMVSPLDGAVKPGAFGGKWPKASHIGPLVRAVRAKEISPYLAGDLAVATAILFAVGKQMDGRYSPKELIRRMDEYSQQLMDWLLAHPATERRATLAAHLRQYLPIGYPLATSAEREDSDQYKLWPYIIHPGDYEGTVNPYIGGGIPRHRRATVWDASAGRWRWGRRDDD